jgi:quercetin dioxygenase-like cupin family protein
MVKEVSFADTFVQGNEFIEVYNFNKGEGIAKHEHLESHKSFCKQGSCIVRTEDKNFIIGKELKFIHLVPFAWHEFEALEDNTILINIFKKLNV